MYQSQIRGGIPPFPSSARALPAPGRRCCSRRPATPSRCTSAATPTMTLATSHWAGGMLAPWCEAETSEPVIGRLGIRSLDLWREHFPETPFNGSLVVAHARDRADFERFARLTSGHRRLDAQGVERTRTVAGRPFPRRRCSIADEGHVEPRRVLPELHARIEAAGGTIKFDSDAERRRSRRHRDRLPRPVRARRRSRSCAASRAR